jgi:hypothetical protein
MACHVPSPLRSSRIVCTPDRPDNRSRSRPEDALPDGFDNRPPNRSRGDPPCRPRSHPNRPLFLVLSSNCAPDPRYTDQYNADKSDHGVRREKRSPSSTMKRGVSRASSKSRCGLSLAPASYRSAFSASALTLTSASPTYLVTTAFFTSRKYGVSRRKKYTPRETEIPLSFRQFQST